MAKTVSRHPVLGLKTINDDTDASQTLAVGSDPSNPLTTGGLPLTFSQVAGSPFTLTTAWQKVATTTSATKGLRLAPIASAGTYDIEWVAVAAGAAAPTDTYGEPVLGGEDFQGGLPIGDVYLKSASGQIAIVKTGA